MTDSPTQRPALPIRGSERNDAWAKLDKKVRFESQHTVRYIENVRCGDTTPFTTKARREPIRKDGADRDAPAILLRVHGFVQAYNKKFCLGAQSSTKGYIGNDPIQRERSRMDEDRAFNEICRNRTRALRSLATRAAYRVACATGQPAGNSEELSLAMKDLANAEGLAARVVEIRIRTDMLSFTHRLALVADGEQRLDALERLPSPDSRAAEGLVIIDKFMKIACKYSDYPEYFRARAKNWEQRDIGIRDERSGHLVRPVASGFIDGIDHFPIRAKVLPFDDLSTHDLRKIRARELTGSIVRQPPESVREH